MTSAPTLTDRAQLTRARARAVSAALFLHHEAIAEIKDRLELVNKRFTAPAVVTGFPQLWQSAFPEARVVEDAETLDLAPGAHDLVIHGLALHWANDPVGQLIQARLALKPDGLCIAATFGGQTLHELRACLAEAEAEVSGGLSPRVAPMADIRDYGALLQRAGLALPVADSLRLNVQYRDIWALMQDLRQMGETNALASRRKAPTVRKTFARAAEIYAEHHAAKNGHIVATFELIMLTGWAPDPSQPQPLRPGAATARLAEALGTTETKILSN